MMRTALGAVALAQQLAAGRRAPGRWGRRGRASTLISRRNSGAAIASTRPGATTRAVR